MLFKEGFRAACQIGHGSLDIVDQTFMKDRDVDVVPLKWKKQALENFSCLGQNAQVTFLAKEENFFLKKESSKDFEEVF